MSDMNRQMTLFESSAPYNVGEPVECLGLVFANDADRRAYFTELLREMLRDPEFRKIEGFPIGEDEDILALSDPPYYTACPNPWIADFVAEWEAQKPPKPEGYQYHREPFAADVSEGKNDPIYNAHSYHTKVPHKAIMRYILHYTEPGDIIFDGFCGTGMTGVAAQMCGDRKEVESLGYRVEADGAILQQEPDADGKKRWVIFSKLGARRAVLNDLSPAATFIAYNYNTPVQEGSFTKEARRTLRRVEDELGWMYETQHVDGRVGKVNYVVWSDVFICPACGGEVVFWEAAVDSEGELSDIFQCLHCSASIQKNSLERAWVTRFDGILNRTVRQAKRSPVLINYLVGKNRFEKPPDSRDLALMQRIDDGDTADWFPTAKLPIGDKTGEPLRIGITHAHHFYSRRNLVVLARLWNAYQNNARGRMAITSVLIKTASILHNIGLKKGKINLAGALPNAMYVPSNLAERNLFELIDRKLDDLARANLERIPSRQVVATASLGSDFVSTAMEGAVDYIFIDPPFGSNLHYSELSFLWEAWLGILTNNKQEAIENRSQGKGLDEYRRLMTECFTRAYDSLKAGRWITVEFSNTNSSVWNSIQTAMSDAGFVVSNVSALDKGQGSFNAQTNPTSVKQDLVISAYKPNGGFEKRFKQEAYTQEGVWEFVRNHLRYLPVVKEQDGTIQVVLERDPRILFDQMVAYYVRNGYPVPISSQEFQLGLAQRFSERDGMHFLPEQVAEYDRARLAAPELVQASLFVSDEDSSIRWLRQLLKEKPQVFSDINPQYMRHLGGWSRHEEQRDLRELLNENFICFDGRGEVPSQIHSYLSSNYKDLRNLAKDDPALQAMAKDRWYVPDPNKAADLEKLREKGLLREFENYCDSKQRRLKVFRLEAVRAGFKKAWQEGDYKTIIDVARKIPDDVLQEDPKLLMWYDQALTRTGQME